MHRTEDCDTSARLTIGAAFELVNRAYGDNALVRATGDEIPVCYEEAETQTFFNEDTDSGDTLALYVLRELGGCIEFNGDGEPEGTINLEAFLGMMETAIRDLERVRDAVQAIQDEQMSARMTATEVKA